MTNACGATRTSPRWPARNGWGLIARGALLVEDDTLRWVGADADLPAGARRSTPNTISTARSSRPGLVDCHTHLVYGGDRAREFELRLQGASYEEIARAGGGIRSTVAATRAASDERAVRGRARRARALMAEGVTTLEIKSGYGLSREHEARCLRVARRLGARAAADGAHDLPGRARAAAGVRRPRRRLHRRGLRLAARAARRGPGRRGRRLLRAHRLHAGADAARVRGRARARPAGQAARRAAQRPGRRRARRRFGALSLRPPRIPERRRRRARWRAAGSVAVLLPGAFYFLRETKLPPVQALRDAGVPIAIATDHNPGSSPDAVAAADAEHGLHAVPPDARGGAARRHRATRARALGLRDRGTLAAGQRADFVGLGRSSIRPSSPTGSATTPAGASSPAACERRSTR